MTFFKRFKALRLVQFWVFALFLLMGTGSVSAQTDVLPSSVDIRLVQGSTPSQLLIQVKLHSTAPFGGIFSALTVTIRYEQASGASLGAGTSFCNAWSAFSPSPVVVNNGIAYRTYNGFGLNRLEDSEFDGGCGLSLPVETWFTVTTIPVGGSVCTVFTLGNDAYTYAENRDYYISMAGIDVTGLVDGGPVTGGNCTVDCLGVSGGTALPGTPCDDGNASTTDDTWGSDCVCSGTAVTYDCPNLQANVGDACDDGNANTTNDVVTAECVCAGTLTYDCPNLQANIGDACDDGNANTTNDVVTAECVCAGTLSYDCPNLQANIGDACDDGDSTTVADQINPNCICQGTSTVGISDIGADAQLVMTLVPNPTANGQFTMHLVGLVPVHTTVRVTVRDVAGHLVFRSLAEAANGEYAQHIDLPGKASGVYMVEVVAGKQRFVQRLVVL